MQQGQTDILIPRFLDPNYGVKIVNFIITPLTYRDLSIGSSLRYSEVSLVCAFRSNASLYYAKMKGI